MIDYQGYWNNELKYSHIPLFRIRIVYNFFIDDQAELDKIDNIIKNIQENKNNITNFNTKDIIYYPFNDKTILIRILRSDINNGNGYGFVYNTLN